MSHELRTPLNAIQGYTEALIEDKEPDDPDQHELAAIQRATRHLLALVESVLDLNQLKTGRFQVDPREFPISEVVNDVVDAIREQAEKNRSKTVVEIPEDLSLYTDKRMVRQILFNLAHNAARFTFKGTVRISVRPLDLEHFEMVVADDGIGMTEAQIRAATQAFWQADASTTRKYDGAGVGLAVCKGLAEAMGGSMRIQSKMGDGATVTVELPRAAEAPTVWDLDDEPTVLQR